MKRAYFVMMRSAWAVRVKNRRKTRSNRRAWLEWDYGRL